MILLTLQNVTKSFAMNTVLKDVNLTLQAGSRMGLVGVNGSGKSTLFRLISGVMEPDEGTISLVKGTRVGVLTQDADIQSLVIGSRLECVVLSEGPLKRPSSMRVEGHIACQLDAALLKDLPITHGQHYK